MAKILLIEDDPTLQSVIRATLQRTGHEVTVTGDGKEGLDAFKAGSFDLVLTDCVMPQMEGIETIQAIRKLVPDARIIAMSGGGRGKAVDYLRMARHLGAQGTLQKPFTIDELVQAVNSGLAPRA